MRFFFKTTIYIFIIIFGFIFLKPMYGSAGESFFISKERDAFSREEIEAELINISSKLNWYAEKEWWQGLSSDQKTAVKSAIEALTKEFETKIYPELTAKFGSIYSSSLEAQRPITILLHRMHKDMEGYVASKDEYDRLLVPTSNQRKMLYVSADKITESNAKSILAHEFMHLIVLNQKIIKYGLEEEVWWNEAIAEAASRYLGYDKDLKDSNLRKRIQEFLMQPNDSLLGWNNRIEDYASLNLFMQYLIDKYGIEVVVSAIKNQAVGVDSLNLALKENGFKEDFSQIFINWVITLLINDCSVFELYCYSFPPLRDFRITPRLNFFRSANQGSISVSLSTKPWSPNWHKFSGISDDFALEFNNISNAEVVLPYVIEYEDGTKKIEITKVSPGKTLNAELTPDDKKTLSFTLMPLITEGNIGSSYLFYWRIIGSKTKSEVVNNINRYFLEKDREELLLKIEELKELIDKLKAEIFALKIAKLLAGCTFDKNLYYGLRGKEVKCLQEFLKLQGSNIYPEGLVTGNFLELTQKAVIRFQEKYASDILYPLGLVKGTGFVGPLTNTKIRELVSSGF